MTKRDVFVVTVLVLSASSGRAQTVRVETITPAVETTPADTVVADNPTSPRTEPRRVIWLCIDSLRADHLGYMGYERDTSPWLNKLAAKSVNFRLAITPSDGTAISVPSYLSGKYFSMLHPNPRAGLGIPEHEQTLAEGLAGAEFESYIWTANGKLSRRNGFGQGLKRLSNLRPITQPKASIDEFITHLQANYEPSKGKEFHYFHIMDVHYPYRPPMPFDTKFADASYARANVRDGSLYDERGEYIRWSLPFVRLGTGEFSEGRSVDAQDLKQLVGLYDGAIRYVDSRLPRLLEKLGYDSAEDLLIITADHAEQFFEHGFWGHGYTTLVEEIHVPLLVRYDGFKPATIDEPVSVLDLYATLLELYGIDVPPGGAGQSLLPALREGAVEERFAYSEGYPNKGPKATVVSRDAVYQLSTQKFDLYSGVAWPYEERLFLRGADGRLAPVNLADHIHLANSLNAQLRKMNPLFENFDPSRFRGQENSLELGENLMSLELRAEAEPAELTEAESDRPLAITLLPASKRWTATVESPAEHYSLSFEYRLSSGAIRAEFKPSADGKTAMWFECRVPQTEWTPFSAVVRPQSLRPEFSVAMTEAGNFQIRNVSLQHMAYPKIQLQIRNVSENADATEDVMTEAEKAQLKALGYLE